jgi:pimeloyl-ACP methyl ester carboxylesterase
MSRRQMIYLHGFASSPRSTKASWLTARARAIGMPLVCPDLNGDDFEGLTITRMIDHVVGTMDALPDGPVVLVGSSLGAFVALFVAERCQGSGSARRHPIESLVFLAPALDLAPGLTRHFGPARMAEWRTTGRLEVFHHAENRTRTLGYGFFADAERYDAFAATDETPTLAYQGTRDDTVEPAMVSRWAAARPHVHLRLLDDDHQLLASLDVIWTGMCAFLLLP